MLAGFLEADAAPSEGGYAARDEVGGSGNVLALREVVSAQGAQALGCPADAHADPVVGQGDGTGLAVPGPGPGQLAAEGLPDPGAGLIHEPVGFVFLFGIFSPVK